MTMYSFVPRFCDAKLCGAVFDKLGCVCGAGEKKILQNTVLDYSNPLIWLQCLPNFSPFSIGQI